MTPAADSQFVPDSPAAWRRMALVLEDPGGRPLEDLLGKPLECVQFLRIAVGLVESLRKLHERGLIHKDVRPANVFLHPDGRVLLTGSDSRAA